MKVRVAALVIMLGAIVGGAAKAQDAQPSGDNALQRILEEEIAPERMALGMKIVELSGTTRIFDEVLPTIAEDSKKRFINANPQMQLGIIAVVDKIAVELVKRRPELDQYLARVWASGFTDEEMQAIIDFYSTDVGKKFSNALPQILAVQTAAAQQWGKSVGEELNLKVQDELRRAVAVETEALESDIAGPAAEEPAPAQ
jgi:uncharacterized protein